MPQKAAKDDVVDRARLLMTGAQGVSTYTATQIKPLLETQMKYTFLPQSIPAYSAAEVLAHLAKTYPDYAFKSAMLNPTNLMRATARSAWEEDIVSAVPQQVGRPEGVHRRARHAHRHRAVHRAPDRHHSDPGLPRLATARPTRRRRRSPTSTAPANGFGWTLNEPIGAQVVSVPMTLPLRPVPDQARSMVVMGVLIRMCLVADRRGAQPDALAAGHPAW